MADNSNALLQIESVADPQGDAAALTNTGDNTKFEFGFAPLSRIPGFEAAVWVAGISEGLAISATANDDEIAYSAGKAVLPSAPTANADTGLADVAAGTVGTLTRPTAGNVLIVSIVVNPDLTVTAVDGTEATNFTANRNVAGGPPYIPATSLEVGQLRLTSDIAAPIGASEISQIPGQSRETSDRPIATIDYFDGTVTFSSALPLIHAGGTPKEIFGKGAVPQFVDQRSVDWVPARNAFSANSTQIYGEVVAGTTQTLNNATVTLHFQDGITDFAVGIRGQERWFKFFQDRDRAPYQLTLGKLGLTQDFTPNSEPTATATVVPVAETRDYAS